MKDCPGSGAVSRVDLHVHSTASADGDSAWLKRLRFQESRTSPRAVYDMALRRGMDFVTLTDHDTIEGALRLAHLDRFVIGEEVTARFPDDGAVVHVVTLGIDENRHRDLQALRGNLYELAGYLHRERVVHFVAHPFFRMGPPLTLAHFERLLLLFKTFEVKNGGKQLKPDSLLEDILAGLSPETLRRLADRHGLEPLGEEPWRKHAVAGSDDHGGLYVGRPHTVTPAAADAAELLGHIAAGRTRAEGPGGSPLAVAHGVLSVAYQNFKHGRSRAGRPPGGAAWNVLAQLFDNSDQDRSASLPLRGLLAAMRFPGFASRAPLGRKAKTLKAAFLRRLGGDSRFRSMLRRGVDFDGRTDDNDVFSALTGWIQDAWRLHLGRGEFPPVDALPTALATALVGGAYAAALKTEYRDRPLIRRARRAYARAAGDPAVSVVFTDGSAREVVEALVRKWLGTGPDEGPVRVLGLSDEPISQPGRTHFGPLGSARAGGGSVAVPPLFEIIRALYDLDAERVFVRTFGPMGLLGLALGRWIGAETVCRVPSDETVPEPLRAAAHRAVRLADRVVALTPAEARTALALGVPDRRIDRRFGEWAEVHEPDPDLWEERLE